MTTHDDIPERQVTAADIALPAPAVARKHGQDQEWCVVAVDGEWQKIRFHDYDQIYAIPGLYETIFYEVLRCNSPARIRTMLEHCLQDTGCSPENLRVLDLGAGNGMVGEELADLGAGHIVGADIIPEAARAARRDRRDVYQDYLILDMTRLSAEERARLARHRFNALTCVAALGFGDIPAAAFAGAFNFIEPGGWVAFNIKSDFLDSGESGSFAGLIHHMIERRILTVEDRQRYPHRLGASGKPLFYTAMVGRKTADIPDGGLN